VAPRNSRNEVNATGLYRARAASANKIALYLGRGRSGRRAASDFPDLRVLGCVNGLPERASRFGVRDSRSGVRVDGFGGRASRFHACESRSGERADGFGVCASRFHERASRCGVRADGCGGRGGRVYAGGRRGGACGGKFISKLITDIELWAVRFGYGRALS
jgi:hypothetical protein